jgi:Outer membrane protein beta-barrel domain
MKKKKILFLLSFLFVLSAFGQYSFGLKLNGGACYFTTKYTFTPPSNSTQKFYLKPSGQGGAFFRYNLSDKFLLGADLLFLPIYGKEKLTSFVTDNNGNLTGEFYESILLRHYYYLGIPVYFGFSRNKFNYSIGMQTNIVIASGAEEIGNAYLQGQYYQWHNKAGKLVSRSYDIGIRLGLLYQANDRFSFEANYYYGLINLVNSKPINENWFWRVQQMTLGINYRLWGN